ncbi:hypothetical protein D5018_05115 [Parashewanella curva]|uniref:Uncharacterized protein n=1 Tax=Parashewanella curva TaxID=2338552 RepID=A0A3L8Q1A3_9GAMM|nr:hypothetical protein [Parashewanella curva]RLV60849.1 hypothetical protein D5018_05115 [Parashewanella curva]
MNKLENSTQVLLNYGLKDVKSAPRSKDPSQNKPVSVEIQSILRRLFFETPEGGDDKAHFGQIVADFKQILLDDETEMSVFTPEVPSLASDMFEGKYGTFIKLQQSLPEDLQDFFEVDITENGTVNYLVNGSVFHSENIGDLLLDIKNERGEALFKHLPEDLRQHVKANRNDFIKWLVENEPGIEADKIADDLIRHGSADSLIPALKYYLSEHPCGVEVKALLNKLQLNEYAISDAAEKIDNPSAPEHNAPEEEWRVYNEITKLKGHLMNLNMAYLLLNQS